MKRKIANKLCIVAFFWGVLIFMAACSDSKKDWSKMSPAEIVERYLAARNSGDTATIRKITYFSPGETESEIERKIQSAVASAEEKGTLRIFGVKTKVEYGKVIDSDTAEAGIIMDAVIGRRTPLMQVVLKRDEGIWKYHYSKSELTDEQLREMIKRNPPDPDAFYLLGRKMIASNRKRATRYFMRYKELAPDGFWISSSMNDHIKNNALLDP